MSAIPFNGFDWHERACTAEEIALIEAHDAAAEAEERAETTAFAEAQRDAFFARLRRELGRDSAPPDSANVTHEYPPERRPASGA